MRVLKPKPSGAESLYFDVFIITEIIKAIANVAPAVEEIDLL